MNDDIKEILSYLELYKNLEEGLLPSRKKKLLLDYITNLQQRIEYLERSNNRREDTIMGLRDEIVEYEDYKSRIEKAVEYIQKLKNFKIKYVMLEEKELYATENDFVKELLDILNGDNNE